MQDVYRVVLTDGTELGNLTMNGNNFISSNAVNPTIFEGNTSPVTIYKNNTPQIHEHMSLVQISQRDGAYWFILRDISQKELDEIQLRADVDFIAMMADVEL